MKYLSGKDYPWLCSPCQNLIDSLVMVVEEGPDSDDEEAPCNLAYDQWLFCDGKSCWDSEYSEWGIRDVRSLYQVFLDEEDGESTLSHPNENGIEIQPTELVLKVVREILSREPGYGIEQAQQLADALWTEFELREAINRSKASLPVAIEKSEQLQRQAA